MSLLDPNKKKNLLIYLISLSLFGGIATVILEMTEPKYSKPIYTYEEYRIISSSQKMGGFMVAESRDGNNYNFSIATGTVKMDSNSIFKCYKVSRSQYKVLGQIKFRSLLVSEENKCKETK